MTNTLKAHPKWADIQQQLVRVGWVTENSKSDIPLTQWIHLSYFYRPDCWCCWPTHEALLWLIWAVSIMPVVSFRGLSVTPPVPEFMDTDRNVFRHRSAQIRADIRNRPPENFQKINTWHQEQRETCRKSKQSYLIFCLVHLSCENKMIIIYIYYFWPVTQNWYLHLYRSVFIVLFSVIFLVLCDYLSTFCCFIFFVKLLVTSFQKSYYFYISTNNVE